jgi:malate dehydrogenase (oxaloacetate-decarboxylating)
VLFKSLAGIDAFPICINASTSDEIVTIVSALEPTFGGINLEDIAAPVCFAAEAALKEKMNIPVFHDDQHGTAIVVLAGLTNALKVVEKDIAAIRAVINGAGAAGIAIGKILLDAKIGDLVMCDKAGILDPADANLNPYKTDIAKKTNKSGLKGSLADAMKGADVFIGVSAPNAVSPDMVRSMNKDAILFALANPVMEISPEAASAAGARIIATGSSNYPNQVNNLLAFPRYHARRTGRTRQRHQRSDETSGSSGDRRHDSRRNPRRLHHSQTFQLAGSTGSSAGSGPSRDRQRNRPKPSHCP